MEVVHSGFNLLAVDALDDAAGCYARILHIERTTLDNLLNLQAVALILRVEEDPRLAVVSALFEA